MISNHWDPGAQLPEPDNNYIHLTFELPPKIEPCSGPLDSQQLFSPENWGVGVTSEISVSCKNVVMISIMCIAFHEMRGFGNLKITTYRCKLNKIIHIFWPKQP